MRRGNVECRIRRLEQALLGLPATAAIVSESERTSMSLAELSRHYRDLLDATTPAALAWTKSPCANVTAAEAEATYLRVVGGI